jgi:hypothetical protein
LVSEEDRPILEPFPTDQVPVYNNITLHGSIHDHNTRLCQYAAMLPKEVDLGQFSVNLNAFLVIKTRLSHLAARRGDKVLGTRFQACKTS